MQVVQIYGIQWKQEAGEDRRQSEASWWNPDHQGGQGGGQWQIPLHGQQLCWRGECGDRPDCYRFFTDKNKIGLNLFEISEFLKS